MTKRTGLRSSAIVALMGALAMPLAAAADTATQEAKKAVDKVSETASDAWVTTKVKIALLTAENVPTTDVNVDTVDGRVTLHGLVATNAQKIRAEEMARAVEGVRDVRNLLQLSPDSQREETAMADDALRTRVEAELAKDKSLADSDIRVASVNGGVVLLSGTATSLSEHREALRTAAGVPGVVRVTSEVKSPERLADTEVWREGGYDAEAYERSAARDAWITTSAKMRLLASTETPGMDINVDTTRGVVTLFGVVPSEASKLAAATEVKKVDGVREVRNGLQIVPDARKEVVQAQDADVKAAVESRLQDRSDLRDAKIGVEVSKGIVRLTGTVDSAGDRLVVLTVARSTPGVRGLIDDLKADQSVSAR